MPRSTPRIVAPVNYFTADTRAHSCVPTGGGGAALRGPPRERARGRAHESHEERGSRRARGRDTRRAGCRGGRTPRASPRGSMEVRGEIDTHEGLEAGPRRRGGLRRRHERQSRRVGRRRRGRVHPRGGTPRQRGGIRTRPQVQSSSRGRTTSAGMVRQGIKRVTADDDDGRIIQP